MAKSVVMVFPDVYLDGLSLDGRIFEDFIAEYDIEVYSSITPKESLFLPVSVSASRIPLGSIRLKPDFMVIGYFAAITASLYGLVYLRWRCCSKVTWRELICYESKSGSGLPIYQEVLKREDLIVRLGKGLWSLEVNYGKKMSWKPLLILTVCIKKGWKP